MAQITTKRTGQLARKVFEILMKHPDGLPARKVIETVESELPLTDFEKSFYPNRPHFRRFEKIVRFSTIGPVKAGWLVKNKGIWSVTDEGRQAFERFSDPAAFIAEANRLYWNWRRSQPEEEDEAGGTPGPAATIEEAEEAAWAEIQTYLSKMNPYDFQELVGGLLRGMNYHVW